MRNSCASDQLRLIADLHQLFSSAQVEHWLAGGWGIDFAIGKMTRHHGDIDFAIWKDDWARVKALLLNRGFVRQENEFPDETGRLLKEGCEIEFYLLQRTGDGQMIVGGRWSDWPFAEGSFEKTIGEYEGIKCPVMTLAGQLESKLHWAHQKHGGPPRDKDISDIELLRSHLPKI